MKKLLLCIVVALLIFTLSATVIYAKEGTDEMYCDVSALTFDEKGNPTHDENGEELLFGACINGGYVYMRADFSAVCTGIDAVEDYPGLDAYYSYVRTLYVADGVSYIDGSVLSKLTSLETLRIGNTLEIFDCTNLTNIDFELIIEGDKTESFIVIANPISDEFSESFMSVYEKVLLIFGENLEEEGWDNIYYYKNGERYFGFFEVDGNTYYAFSDGRINLDPEIKINGAIYRFDENGILLEGPLYDKEGVKEHILTSKDRGWVEFMGKTYYVSLVSGEFNEKASLKIGGVIRYFNDDYSVKEGLITESDGTTQRYYVKGEYKIGWIDTDNDGVKESYFLSANGVRVMETRKIGGKIYDCDEGVLTLRQGMYEENGEFYFYKDGVKASGFIEYEGKTYYFLSESKKMITADTYKIGGYVRQFNPDHSVKPIEGWQVKGGKTYYYENGSRVTGFKKIDGYTYYFKKSDDAYGEMASGWISIGGDVYYFFRYGTEKYGRMVTGRQTISSSVYYFNSDGTINTGFVGDSNGNVHYYHYSEMLKGWYEIGGNIYYFTKENGNMATGEKTIGGVKYVFTNKGILLLPSYEGVTVIGGSTQNGNGFDISDGDWSDIIII